MAASKESIDSHDVSGDPLTWFNQLPLPPIMLTVRKGPPNKVPRAQWVIRMRPSFFQRLFALPGEESLDTGSGLLPCPAIDLVDQGPSPHIVAAGENRDLVAVLVRSLRAQAIPHQGTRSKDLVVSKPFKRVCRAVDFQSIFIAASPGIY